MKNRTKLVNIDILKAMGGIVDSHTQHYKSDFGYDIATLKKAALEPKQEDRTFIWLCRASGTWLLKEKNAFVRESHEYSIFMHYAGQTKASILCFIVEVAGLDGDIVTGNLYALDYTEYYGHVEEVAVPAKSITVTYERGQKPISPTEDFNILPDGRLGQFISLEYQPESDEGLKMLLRDEKQNRGCFKAL